MNRGLKMGVCWLLAIAPGLLALAGCDHSSHARYTPTQDEARSSLEAALTAWREGKPYGQVEVTPAVHVADSAWQAGEQIEAFAIGDEEDPGDGTKQFPVKLTMKKDKTLHDVRYVVNGRDPVWVFSEPDYQKTIDMGNGPEPPKSKVVTGRSKRR